MALVDGSAYSESVCHHAAWVAGRTHAQLKIYHVLDPRRARSKRGPSLVRSGSGQRSNLLEELSALDEQHARLAQAQGRAILEDAKAARGSRRGVEEGREGGGGMCVWEEGGRTWSPVCVTTTSSQL